MADNIANVNGKDSFAYVGAAGWHGKGQELRPGASMQTWAYAAGLDYTIMRAAVQYQANGAMLTAEGDEVLYRSDNGARVGIVSDRYQIVQPIEALEFFREFCEAESLQMETAGALQGGSIYWALAKTGRNASFGPRGTLDLINQYVLLSSSADGSRATQASINSTRVVCNNTLRLSDGTAKSRVSTRHSSKFDARKTAQSLGLVDLDQSWEKFSDDMHRLQQISVNAAEATEFFAQLLRPNAKPVAAAPARHLGATDFASLLNGPAVAVAESFAPTDKARAIRGLADLELSYVAAPGACPGTAYGVLQGVTHFIDHVRGSDDKRQASAMFGQGDALKASAFDQLLAMA